MLKKIFQQKINSVATAALLIAFSSLLSRFLGIFRDRILASEFGAGDTLDVYYAAFRVPDLIFNLLVLGALSAGFIPIFAKKIKDSKEDNIEAWKLASNIFNVLGVSLLAVSILAIIFASPLTSLFTPGFSLQKQQAVIVLSRIMFLSPILLGLSSIVGGILQSFKRFFVYSLAPIMYNIGIIIGALYFVPILGIAGLAWGVVLGALLHFLIQLPALFSLGFGYSPIFSLKNKDLQQIGKMMVPRTLSLAIAQIDLLVSTAIASTLFAGSLAIFNFANNLQSFPIGIFGISFATAAFPTLALYAHDHNKLVDQYSRVQRQIFFFIIPATVLILILRAQLIRVVLGSGQFDWQATVLTFDTLGFFALSLFAQASIPLLVRVFYAKENSKKPFQIGMITVFFDIALAWWLSRIMGVRGIALAFSIAQITNFILLWLFLRREIGFLDETTILKSVSKFSLAALIAGFVAQYVKTIAASIVNMETVIGIVIQAGVTGVVGISLYLIICLLIDSEEAWGLVARIKRKLSWSDVQNTDQTEARGI